MIRSCKECGNEPIIQHRYDNTYWVYCCRYYCNNAEVIHAETEEKAIELWNKNQEPESRQICRNCKNKDDCKIDRKKRESLWNGSWDEWTCGMWQEADEVQIIFDEVDNG